MVGAAGAPVALLGHSWGAQLALRYALEHPDRVDRLVYLSGTGLSVTAWRPAFRAADVRRRGRQAARLRDLQDTDPDLPGGGPDPPADPDRPDGPAPPPTARDALREN